MSIDRLRGLVEKRRVLDEEEVALRQHRSVVCREIGEIVKSLGLVGEWLRVGNSEICVLEIDVANIPGRASYFDVECRRVAREVIDG